MRADGVVSEGDGERGSTLPFVLVCWLVAALMVVVARIVLKKFTKMKNTRKTVGADLDMLRRRDGTSPAVGEGSAALASGDGIRGTRGAAELPEGAPGDATLRGGRSLRR